MSYSYVQKKKWQTSGRSRFHIKPPVKVDREYEAEIQEMSRRGDGIAKIDGFIVFVPNTVQGNQVKFRVTKVGNRFAVGELVEN
jgi:predicted RNA-binding protein with TRAM domain